LLSIVFLLEAVIGPRLGFLSWFRIPVPPAWITVPFLLVIALLLVRFAAGLDLRQIGLVPPQEWNLIEKSYFLQVFVLANLIFATLFLSRLRTVAANPTLWSGAGTAAFTYLLWGFYQELVYRGLLQTELVRRWGPLPGILASNLLFTFGPLHFYHFTGSSPIQALSMFAGIFAIGLFFAILFQRSGNLGMVGILHGLGDFYITGLAALLS
jgi:membrane protease YdiL (CAAX protease family)